MTKEQAERKLKALKALAERGVGGEKETAKRLYEELKKKYGAEEETEREETGSDTVISMFYMGMMGFTLQQELENMQAHRGSKAGKRAGRVIADGFYNMDCFQGFNLIDDKSIDLILCDLPFGTTQNEWDVILPFDKLWQQYERIIKDNGAILLFGMEPFSSRLRLSNIDLYKYDWIWQKTNPKGHLNAKSQPMRAHEVISVFYKKQPTYNPQMTHGHQRKTAKNEYTRERDGAGCYGKENRNTIYDSTDRYPLDVQIFSNGDQTKKIHPTEKPVPMLEYFILTYTNMGDLVLDNCAGSGSTGKAAHNTGRRFIGFEKDREIYKRGYKSWKEHTSQITLFSMMKGEKE